MSATKANVNWTGVSHGSTTITRVTNASFGWGGRLIKFKGDTDLYPTIIVAPDQEPHASVTTADVGTVMSIAVGTTATLAATLNDAKSAVGGAVIFTMANAVFENADASAAHAQFGSITATWQAYSSDGSTNPLTISRS
jgi:hypothetical protein